MREEPVTMEKELPGAPNTARVETVTVWAPCKVGQPFTARRAGYPGFRQFKMTGLDFFCWSSPTKDNVVLCGKRAPEDPMENTDFFLRNDLEFPPAIEFEVPADIMRPGFPLRELGLDTGAVGFLSGVMWDPKRGQKYFIGYGKDYAGPRAYVRTAALDKLFAPILPAIFLDAMDYLT